MIFLFFLLAPFFHAVKDRRATLFVALAMLPLAMMLNRPTANVNPLQSFAYFLPVFLFGVVAGYRLDDFRRLAAAAVCPGIVAFVALVLYRSFVLGEFGLYHSTIGDFPGEFDLLLVQKAILCVVLFELMRRVSGPMEQIIGFLARVSFAIYFIHPFGLRVANKLASMVPFELPDLAVFLCVVAVAFASTLISIEIGKRILGRHSRMVFGA
jgi:peptidoglycan/LPS O-acetylase OafA/YrhL